MTRYIAHIAFLLLLFNNLPLAFAYDKFEMPSQGCDIVGENYTITVKKGDSSTTIRQNNGVSYNELLEANPSINFYKLKVGQTVLIPKLLILPKYRNGIVVNTAELLIYYFPKNSEKDGKKYVYIAPVGLGRADWRTPLAETKITEKIEDPIWTAPESIRNYIFQKTGVMPPKITPAGPNNPLGKYALRLSLASYMIHGTNVQTSVGTFISSGCMRLMPDDIKLLYQIVPIGTPVHIIYQPQKAGWYNNNLYLESHYHVDSYDEKPESDLNKPNVRSVIYDATHYRPSYINWNEASKVDEQRLGIPTKIGEEFKVPKLLTAST